MPMPEPCRDRLPMAVPSVPKIEERVAQTRVLLREEAPATQEIRTLVRRYMASLASLPDAILHSEMDQPSSE